MASTAFGSSAPRRIAASVDGPQSTSRLPPSAWMCADVWRRPPLPNASPVPRNRSWTPPIPLPFLARARLSKRAGGRRYRAARRATAATATLTALDSPLSRSAFVTFSLRARLTTTPATHPPRSPIAAVSVSTVDDSIS